MMRVANLRERGLSSREIGRELGLSAAAVRVLAMRLRRAGETMPKLPSGRRPESTIVQRVLTVAQGLSVPEIAERLEISKQSVRSAIKYLRRAGYEIETVRDARTRLEQVLALVKRGMAPAAIAQALGTTPNAVSSAISELRREGHEIQVYRPPVGSRTAAYLERVAAGKSAREIAAEFNVGINGVYALLSHARKRGLEVASGAHQVPVPRAAAREAREAVAREPFPISVSAAVAAEDARQRGLAWDGDVASLIRLNLRRNELGIAPMWVHPKALAR